jgi:hypothetical protein
MATSTARQLELDVTPVGADRSEVSASPRDTPVAQSAAQSTVLNVPKFDTDPAVHAVTARLAGRINARAVSDAEHSHLLQERQVLLDKLFDGTIGRKEEHRLRYVRWSLDRIEDARYGSALDMLSDEVRLYENLVAEIGNFRSEVMRIVREGSGRKRGRE